MPRNPCVLFGKGTSHHRPCRESRATDFFHSHGSLVESLVIDKHHVCFLSEGVNLGELIYILGKNTATITVLKYKERCCDEQCPCVRSFFVQFLSRVFSWTCYSAWSSLFLCNKNVNSEALINAHMLLIDTRAKVRSAVILLLKPPMIHTPSSCTATFTNTDRHSHLRTWPWLQFLHKELRSTLGSGQCHARHQPLPRSCTWWTIFYACWLKGLFKCPFCGRKRNS